MVILPMMNILVMMTSFYIWLQVVIPI